MAVTVNGSTGVSLVQDNVIVLADLTATGTASATTFLRGDNAWATPAGGGVTHLGTLDTSTGGTTQSININLSLYNQIWMSFDNVSHSSGSSAALDFAINSNTAHAITASEPAVQGIWGWFTFDLRANVYTNQWGAFTSATTGTGGSGADGNSPSGYYEAGINFRLLTNAPLAITFGGATFDAGSAEVYGIS